MFLAILLGHAAVAQNAPGPLTIISPTNGTVVKPGQTITVTVTRAANSGITSVALQGFGWTPIVGGPDPLAFSVSIPATAQPGSSQIVAFDLTPRGPIGLGAASAPLLLTVQGPIVTSLGANFKAIHFRLAGAQRRVHVFGIAAGVRVGLQDPSAILFSSQNPSVATVDQAGLVTAMGPGQTTVSAIYTNPNNARVSIAVPIFVPQSTHGDLNGDGKVDLEDVAIIQGALNSTAVGPNDARDLNHDGVINALDARILTTLCTYPRCATRP